MSDIKINGALPGDSLRPDAAKGAKPDVAFDSVMNDVLDKLSQVQNDAERSVNGLVQGGDVTQAILDMERADMNFQLMIEVRNKLIAAYEEIMHLQV